MWKSRDNDKKVKVWWEGREQTLQNAYDDKLYFLIVIHQ